MITPYEQPCPACGAPPERVTNTRVYQMYVLRSIEFRCEVCGKRWAEEVKSPACVLSSDDIKALQQALSSEETRASKLVEEAVQKICSMVTENMRLRQVRSSFQDDMCHAGKELRQLRDEVAELRAYADKLVAGIPYLPKDIEILREANGSLSAENKTLRDELSVAKIHKAGAECLHNAVASENRALRNEVAKRCLTEEDISTIQDELGTHETEASKLIACIVKDWADKEAAWDQLVRMYNRVVEKQYDKGHS